jgi:hypothetical protein
MKWKRDLAENMLVRLMDRTLFYPNKEKPSGFETSQAKMIRVLRAGDGSATTLAKRLTRCRKGDMCELSICPICVRLRRTTLSLGALNCTLTRLEREREFPVAAFSAVLATYPSGKLEKVDLPSITEQIQSQHRRTTPLIFAGINVLMYEDAAPKPKPRWQIQLDGIVAGLDVDAVEAAFRPLYPSSSCARKRLRVRECKSLVPAFEPVMQLGFVRRATAIDEIGREKTKKFCIRNSQLRELALCFGRFDISARCVHTGYWMKRRHQRSDWNGSWRSLRVLKPKPIPAFERRWRPRGKLGAWIGEHDIRRQSRADIVSTRPPAREVGRVKKSHRIVREAQVGVDMG